MCPQLGETGFSSGPNAPTRSDSVPAVHPTAVVYPGAELGPGVEIGPYSVIESGVEIGPECRIGPHVHLLGRVQIGAGTTIRAGCVIGGEPQDLKYDGAR